MDGRVKVRLNESVLSDECGDVCSDGMVGWVVEGGCDANALTGSVSDFSS